MLERITDLDERTLDDFIEGKKTKATYNAKAVKARLAVIRSEAHHDADACAA